MLSFGALGPSVFVQSPPGQEDEFFEVVDAKLSLLRLKHKKVITENHKPKIEIAVYFLSCAFLWCVRSFSVCAKSSRTRG